MGFLTALLTFPVSGPINGLVFIAEKLHQQAMEELLDESRIQQQLMELELRRELGEIDDQQYAAREEELLERLDAIQQFKEEQQEE